MKGSEIRCLQIDAFTREPFAGNPAAVCLLPQQPDDARDDAWMQRVAAEMNLSETAFLRRRDGDEFDLRWFTPEVEVALCGHATLASAHALWETGEVKADAIGFHTQSGRLEAQRPDGWIELDFPALATTDIELPELIATGLGAKPTDVGAYHMGSSPETTYVIELASEQILRSLAPDFAALRRTGACVLVTARADSADHDFVSRFFAPAAGIDEDPVTGSAHCALAPYWRERLGKDEMVGYQASRRGGVVGVRVVGDRVRLRGHAVTVLRGALVA